MVEVIAEDEGGAGDGFFEEEGERNAVLVVGMGDRGEVGGCGGGVAGEAWTASGSVEEFWIHVIHLPR